MQEKSHLRGVLELLTLLICLASSIAAMAQAPVNYNDVGVVVNLTDTGAIRVANYFMKKRNIPSQNLIRFKGTTSEIIDSLTFEKIRKQIEDTITGHKIQDKINYLVLTQGCPLKITRSDTCNQMSSTLLNKVRCASFDSELGLILGSLKTSIGKGDYYTNTTTYTRNTHPYYMAKDHYIRKKYNMYLVTRIAAYTQADCYALIDRSGANTYVDRSKVQFVIDNTAGVYDYNLSLAMGSASRMLTKRGWTVKYDSTATFLRSQSNVIGYIGWGYTDPNGKTYKGMTANTWNKAAIGVSYYSYNGSSFVNQTSARSTLPNVIKEGVSGWYGTVYEPWASAFPTANRMFDLYTDSMPDRRYNLAEAYYNAAPSISWMSIIVGDPKTSIYSRIPKKPNPKMDTCKIVTKGVKRTLNTTNNVSGNYIWFKGDSTTLKASIKGYVYPDSTHPSFYRSGKSLVLPVDTAAGTYTFTYLNENVSGRAYRQVTFKVVSGSTKSVFTKVEEKPALAPAEQILSHEFRLKPNPATNECIIFTEQSLPLPAHIEVYDGSGRLMFEQQVAASEQISSAMPMQGWPSGVYFVRLSTAVGISSRKLIISR